MAGRWLGGVLVGAVVGVGSLIGGTVGAALGLVAALLVAIRAPRRAAVGGLCLGLGASWLVVLARADAACGIDCVGPDLTGWYAVGGMLLLVGVMVSTAALRGAGRPR